MIKLSVDKLNRTLNGLPEITRVRKDPERKEGLLLFEDVFQGARVNVEQMIVDCDAAIVTDFQAPSIYYTSYNLRSIMYNLLSNALKYCSPDRKPRIEIKTEQQEGFVVMTTDNSPGMNKSQPGKLFSTFKRFHAQAEGTGIGLYMVKRIIENNGGKIEADSEENKGTSFRVFF